MSRCHIASARSFALALSLACSVGASLVAAQDFRTGAVQSPLRVIPNSNCTELTLWSHPDLFVDDNGTLRLLANGARPQPANCAAPWDRSWSATRSSPTAPWVTPGPANAQSGCPSLIGGYTRCGYSPANPGPIGAASVARAGKRHYMALQGGNADFIVGHIYWAASDDGITWDFHDLNPPPGETWTPLLAPRYHQCENGAPPPPRAFYEIPGGLTEPYLVFDANDHSMGSNGTFYLWVGSYDLRPGTLPPDWMIDSWVIRFGFDPTHPFGLGAAKQIWHRTTATNGTWKPFNSGSMVWNFDAGRPVPGEPVLAAHMGEDPAGAFAGGGGGALQWDPVANNWLHVYTFSGVTKSQRAASLAANLWSAPVEVDMTTTVALVPTGIDPILRKPYEPGLHHGLGGQSDGLVDLHADQSPRLFRVVSRPGDRARGALHDGGSTARFSFARFRTHRRRHRRVDLGNRPRLRFFGDSRRHSGRHHLPSGGPRSSHRTRSRRRRGERRRHDARGFGHQDGRVHLRRATRLRRAPRRHRLQRHLGLGLDRRPGHHPDQRRSLRRRDAPRNHRREPVSTRPAERRHRRRHPRFQLPAAGQRA